MKYKSVDDLVNGDIVSGLTAQLDELLEFPYVQKHAGGLFECGFCGERKPKYGLVENHSSNCPVEKYIRFTDDNDDTIRPYII